MQRKVRVFIYSAIGDDDYDGDGDGDSDNVVIDVPCGRTPAELAGSLAIWGPHVTS